MYRRAFSLLEMLAVVAVMAILSALALPALSTLIKGPTLTQGAQTLTNAMTLARQEATTRNHPIEMRLLRYRDPEVSGEGETGSYHALQWLEVLPGERLVPLGNMVRLPGSLLLAADRRSSLLDGANSAAPRALVATKERDPALPRGVEHQYEYVPFRFLPSGGTTLAASQQWYLTLLSVRDSRAVPETEMPNNFFTLQIDPVSGKAHGYRPGLP
jgi:uncharacterized protein (TIGR02596 family)